ncbi:hypothetical protein BC830DRAFT_623238 [Chytriomyces sp. MP71]|nr:hypothetical protein BC830DRAFT_623238 [Chytriomyces sp. MP71]
MAVKQGFTDQTGKMDILSADKLETIRLLMRSICPFSIIANLSVLFIVGLTKHHQGNLVSRLQAYLSFADIVLSIDWMLGTSIVSNIPFCTFVGLIFEFNTILSTCLVFCISALGYVTVTRGPKSADALKKWYFGYALGVPVLFVIVLVVATLILRRANMIGDATFELSELSELITPTVLVNHVHVPTFKVLDFRCISRAQSCTIVSTCLVPYDCNHSDVCKNLLSRSRCNIRAESSIW